MAIMLQLCVVFCDMLVVSTLNLKGKICQWWANFLENMNHLEIL
jgi:hypothetical protein